MQNIFKFPHDVRIDAKAGDILVWDSKSISHVSAAMAKAIGAAVYLGRPVQADAVPVLRHTPSRRKREYRDRSEWDGKIMAALVVHPMATVHELTRHVFGRVDAKNKHFLENKMHYMHKQGKLTRQQVHTNLSDGRRALVFGYSWANKNAQAHQPVPASGGINQDGRRVVEVA